MLRDTVQSYFTRPEYGLPQSHSTTLEDLQSAALIHFTPIQIPVTESDGTVRQLNVITMSAKRDYVNEDTRVCFIMEGNTGLE